MFAFEGDQFAAVVDRLGDPVDGDGPGLFFEAESVFLLNGCEGLPVGLGDPHGVVVQLVGNARLLGGDADDAVGPEGVEEVLLKRRQRFGHDFGSCGIGGERRIVQSLRWSPVSGA